MSFTYSFRVDDKIESLMGELQNDLRRSSRAEVFRLALALAKVAKDEVLKGNKIAVSDKDGNLIKELVIPI